MPTWGAIVTLFVSSCVTFGAQTTVKTMGKYTAVVAVKIATHVHHPKQTVQTVVHHVSK